MKSGRASPSPLWGGVALIATAGLKEIPETVLVDVVVTAIAGEEPGLTKTDGAILVGVGLHNRRRWQRLDALVEIADAVVVAVEIEGIDDAVVVEVVGVVDAGGDGEIRPATVGAQTDDLDVIDADRQGEVQRRIAGARIQQNGRVGADLALQVQPTLAAASGVVGVAGGIGGAEAAIDGDRGVVAAGGILEQPQGAAGAEGGAEVELEDVPVVDPEFGEVIAVEEILGVVAIAGAVHRSGIVTGGVASNDTVDARSLGVGELHQVAEVDRTGTGLLDPVEDAVVVVVEIAGIDKAITVGVLAQRVVAGVSGELHRHSLTVELQLSVVVLTGDALQLGVAEQRAEHAGGKQLALIPGAVLGTVEGAVEGVSQLLEQGALQIGVRGAGGPVAVQQDALGGAGVACVKGSLGTLQLGGGAQLEGQREAAAGDGLTQLLSPLNEGVLGGIDLAEQSQPRIGTCRQALQPRLKTRQHQGAEAVRQVRPGHGGKGDGRHLRLRSHWSQSRPRSSFGQEPAFTDFQVSAELIGSFPKEPLPERLIHRDVQDSSQAGSKRVGPGLRRDPGLRLGSRRHNHNGSSAEAGGKPPGTHEA